MKYVFKSLGIRPNSIPHLVYRNCIIFNMDQMGLSLSINHYSISPTF